MRCSLYSLLLLSVSAHADLIATFSREGVTDVRVDRFPALSIKPGEPATPFLTAGEFEAVWTGKLVLPKRKRLAFSFEGEGSASLKVGGKELLAKEGALGGEGSKTTRLNPGEHEIELHYKSKPDGTASFRLYWEEAELPRQTIPASAFSAEISDEAQLGERQRAGRLIFTQQHCAKCHIPETSFGAAPMPETGEIGPILIGIGDRVTEEWLRRWIADPKALKPSSHMPTLVDVSTEEGRQQTADLAAYLASLKLGMPQPPAPDPAQAKAGGAHFHELGCAACHTPPDRDQPDLETQRVPLNNVASKYQPAALVSYLKKPHEFYGSTGMPDFKFTDEEAAQIAAYLLEASQGKETKSPHAFPAGDAARGTAVAQSLQCGLCHPGLPMEPSGLPSLDTVFKSDWTASGCVAPADKRGKAPVLNLDDKDREALVAFSKKGSDSLGRDTSAEFAERQMEAQRCTHCHALDGHPALLAGVHHETRDLTAHLEGLHERVDQSRPALTYVGEMLFTTYIESMLSGTANPRPRPWLGMRMPAFHAHPKALAEGLSRLHGFEPGGPAKVEVDPELAAIGKELASASGFGCTTCHGIGDLKPTAAFEVEGINFKLVPERLREEFYHRWMDNPQSITPSTKMPRYADGNESQRGDVLEGDARKQYEAIWHYLHSLKEE